MVMLALCPDPVLPWESGLSDCGIQEGLTAYKLFKLASNVGNKTTLQETSVYVVCGY